MRARIDDERCKGHGMCCTLCPEVFELTDDGFAVIVEGPDGAIPSEHEDAVRSAVAQCPEGAISIRE